VQYALKTSRQVHVAAFGAIVVAVAATAIVPATALGENLSHGVDGGQRTLIDRVVALEAKVAALGTRQEIHDVYRRYIWGFDRRDVALTKSAFWPDAQISYGTTTSTVDQFVTTHFAAHDAVSEKALQPIDEMSVDVQGDTAHVVAYLVEFNSLKNGRSRFSGVRYIDRLDRRSGQWRIAVREVIFEFMTETDNNLSTNFSRLSKGKPYATTPCGSGTRDKRDPSYARPLSARKQGQLGAACASELNGK
jgi:hypothetical protein